MKTLLGIAIIYNIFIIAFSYYRYKKERLSKRVLECLVFSFLLYADLLMYHITGDHNGFTFGIAVCWCIAYVIVYDIIPYVGRKATK